MSFIPYVVEQTSRGERSYDIFSRLLNDRIIFLSEEDITAEYEAVAKQYELELDKVKTMVPEEEIKAGLETRKAVKVIVDSAVAVAPKKEEATEE